MKQQWFTGMVGAIALIGGAAWTQLGAAHAVSFTPPPGSAAPTRSTGGASRGGLFTPPPGSAAPNRSTGGASRGGLFTPPPGSAAPTRSAGGASRGGFFTPPPDNRAPHQSAGGASRGSFFVPPVENGAPQQTAGGASRINAYGGTADSTSVQALLALLPDNFYGTTLKERPTIMVHLPASTAEQGLFVLKNDTQEVLFEMNVAVPAQGGVIAVELPENAPALALNQTYEWFFALQVDGELTPSSPFVEGWIERIEPSVAQAQAAPQSAAIERIAALGAQGIWYDTVAELATLQANEETPAIAQHWQELLESVGLVELAATPIVTP
jgi:hypothetical protein